MKKSRVLTFLTSPQGVIAAASLLAIAAHLILSAGHVPDVGQQLPLWIVVGVGGSYLLWGIARGLIRRTGGVDILAAISIICAAIMGEWLVAAIIVLMLSGGEGLEAAATARASAVLDALAQRAPTVAHRRVSGKLEDCAVEEIAVGDELVILPHELCPVDGEVTEGHGVMDESYLTGEPYMLTKSVGSHVMSGAINGEDVLAVRADKVAADSRYAQIVGVLTEAEQNRPPMRRLADRLGVWYTAIALVMGVLGWVISGDPERFLAVVVIATPCPLLIGVPVAIIGAISLSARAGIIIKDPGVLERLDTTHTMMFDKTGTLTYGRPVVSEVLVGPGHERAAVLGLAAQLELYSRHPLAAALVQAAGNSEDTPATADCVPDGAAQPARVQQVSERPGQGLTGLVDSHTVQITSRARAARAVADAGVLPAEVAGMECVVLVDGAYAATVRFRDEPRVGAREFVEHLRPRHKVATTMMISGDKSTEVEYVARLVGIDEVHSGCSPEEKLAIVQAQNTLGTTTFLGDGINDAPAMAAASSGIAFGTHSDITSEAAGAVVLDSSLERLDELLHISERLRRIALQTAIGGVALSFVGMVLAVCGQLTPVVGAIAQEGIDLLAILNAARVAIQRRPMADYQHYPLPERSAGGPRGHAADGAEPGGTAQGGTAQGGTAHGGTAHGGTAQESLELPAAEERTESPAC